MRDLARYRARSGAALAAISLATGIAAAIALATAVSAAKAAAPTGGNLPANQVVVWMSQGAMGGQVPVLTAAQVDTLQREADAIAQDLHATSVLALTGAVDPTAPLEHGGRSPMMLGQPHREGGGISYSSNDAIPLFVATSEVLRYYGIDPASISADTDLLTPRSSVDGYDLFPGRFASWHPKLQHVTLPDYSSAPNALLTTHAMEHFGFTTQPVGWLINATGGFTGAQIDAAQQSAAAAGLYVESRPTGADQARLANQFTGVGIAVALGVLAMTVGLIRSETSRDLRTLTATGARRRTRRTLTAATASSLAFAGAIIGTACAYVALIAWYHQEVHWLSHPPVVNLLALLLGLPIVAYLGGYLLAGRAAPAIARQPLE
jgi:putative ABC transport system permease protein